MKRIFISILLAILLGAVVSRYLFVNSYLNLVPWGLAGLLIGFYCKNIKEAVLNGMIYGFLLAFSFMWVGYQGSFSIISRIPFFTILGLIGAACGIILTTFGLFIKDKINK